jgi:hypothetical protein
VHQQDKEGMARYAPAGEGEEGQICTSKHRRSGQMCTSRIKRGWPDMHQQAKNKRDGCAPAGKRRRGTDVRQQDKEGMARYAPAG